MYSLLTLPHSIVIYCHKFQIVYNRLKGEGITSVDYSMLSVTRLELPLRFAGLLLRLLNS